MKHKGTIPFPGNAGAAFRSRTSIPGARIAAAVSATLLVFISAAGFATQLNLANSPLFLSVPVPSNIFFLHDDSGSMDWDMVTSEDDGVMLLTAGGNTTRYTYLFPLSDNVDTNCDSCTSGKILPSEEAVQGTANMPSDAHGVWRGRYSGYNKMYYNPDIDYKPWPGLDSAGVSLPDAKAPATEPSYIALTALRLNPYSSTSATVNITQSMSWTSYNVPATGGTTPDVSVSNYHPARYYTWTDSNSNGTVDAADTHTLYEIRDTSDSNCTAGATCPASFSRASTRVDCATQNSDGTRTCTRAEELKNFANWFMHHRRRQQASKYAIGKVVDQAQSGARMGHATFNANGGASNVNIGMAQMNASSGSGNKKALLDALYKVQPSGGTPLRTQLDATGRYYECVSGNIFGLPAGSASCPIVTAAAGGTCQQNFAVAVTDGYWNDSFSGVGNADGDGNTGYDTLSYRDSYSNTLADVAMYYYERDLATNLSNQVPVTTGVDDATHQHMATYTVAFGVSGTLSAGPTSTSASFPWPDPAAGDAQKIDDLRHAAYNGRGQFYSAQNSADLATSLLSTIGSIGDRTGSSASVAVNSRSLGSGTRLYQARFTSGEWSGDLRALAVDTSGNVGSQVWSAKEQVKNQDWSTGRAILTRNGSRGIPFRWITSGANALTAAQMAGLNDNPVTTVVDNNNKGEARLNWLRGSTTDEGTGNNFRVRKDGFKLGDIVNSSPIFVGSPISLPDLETTPHSSFRSTYVSRREMVYVGANDGMLHGFDAATGQEKIAYVPSMLFSETGTSAPTTFLGQLTYTGYAHRYYVDGSPTVGDAYGTFTNVSGVCGSGCWRTVLAGGLGGGGKGVYALDVTDPDGTQVSGLAFSENNAPSIALWEFTDSSTPSDMGYVYGQPIIAKVRNDASDTKYSWAAIFGNGYNSTNENAVLYILNIKNGSIIGKIELNPYTASTGNSNGLSAPAVVDTDGDYIADHVYAGDLRGNLWKIDITGKNPSDWKSAHKSGSTPKPLFAAVDGTTSTTVEQPISVRPEVGKHPDGQSGYMVYFGTGRYIATGDNTTATSPVQTFYGIWDKPYTGSGTPVTRADLLPQTITEATVASTTVRQVTDTAIQWRTGNSGTCQSDGSGTCLGWRDDLRTAYADSAGEKAVSNPVLVGGTVPRIVFTTLVPQTDPCSAGGTGWLMELNPKNGGRLAEQVFDITGDGKISSSDMIGGTIPVAGVNPGIGIMPEPTILRDPANKTDLKAEAGSTGAVTTLKNYVGSTTSGGRQSWRQLK